MPYFSGAQDHHAYVQWVDEHPDGYVVQFNQSTALVLHLATCGCIRGTPPFGEVWTNYPKLCDATRTAAIAEARQRSGIAPRPCGRCQP